MAAEAECAAADGKEVDGTFEWLVDVEALAPKLLERLRAVLPPALVGGISDSAEDGAGGAAEHEAVVLGCGTSGLSAWVADCPHLRFGGVVSMDSVPEIIAEMRRRRPDLGWEAATFAEFNVGAAGRRFAAAFDKGTFDVALTDDGDAAELLRCVHRSLAPGAPWAVVSFRPTALVEPLLAGGGFFELLSDDNFGASLGLPHVNLTVFRRLQAPTRDGAFEEDDDALWALEKERQKRICNAWFREVEPLLTPERRADLQSRWAEAAAGAAGCLPLSEARLALFTDAELAVYDLEDFLGDLRSFRQERGGEQAGDPATISLQEALAFLAANQ